MKITSNQVYLKLLNICKVFFFLLSLTEDCLCPILLKEELSLIDVPTL